MTIVQPGAIACSSRGASSTGPVPVAYDLLKFPNPDDIYVFTRQVQETTHVLSRLLLNETTWRNGLSSEQGVLLETSAAQFHSFCEECHALLQVFLNFSRQFVTVFASTFDSAYHPNIEQFARELRREMESITTRISSVERLYIDLTSQVRRLMCIAPFSHNRHLQTLHEDDMIFQRLDAFWKVVATQLSAVLESSQLPHPDFSHHAKIKWEEYHSCVWGAMIFLMESSDALKASGRQAPQRLSLFSLGARLVGKVLRWFGLMRGQGKNKKE